jgi:hypothetical protein
MSKLVAKLLIAMSTIFAAIAMQVQAAEVTAPVVSGMVLSLGDSAQQIKVRAKSLGPGACGVSFSIGGKSDSFLAPPLTWSPWTAVGPAFLGKSTQKLELSISCDTGAIAEVRYVK